MTTLLIVDDHPVFRSGLAGLIAAVPGLELVDQVGTAAEAAAVVRAAPPDVVLMDINLPGESGVEATEAILAIAPAVAVLMITMVDDDDSVFAALRAGARGYVLKGAPAQEIIAAINAVAAGGAVFGAGVAQRILDRPSKDADSSTAVAGPGGDLTARETEVLQLLGTGASNPEIARTLGVSVKTVQNHVSRVLDKLHAADRTAAALRARDLSP